MDNFGIKYIGRENAEHLKASIEKNDEISCDWAGTAYCGLKLKWDYDLKIVDLSMPGYIKTMLHKFQHPAPALPEHAPHPWNTPVYGAKTQFIETQEERPLRLPQKITRIQQLVGTLIYYSRAVDPNLVMPVNVLSS